MTLQPELRFVTHRNHYLFSGYYLTHRVAERQEWTELDARPHLHAELAAVRTQIERTDRLIDQVVYRLYGLTEEEIAVVEGSV